MRIDSPVSANAAGAGQDAAPIGEQPRLNEAVTGGLVLVRRLDGVTYRFDREPEQWNGRVSYRRIDLPLWIRRTDAEGWAVVDAQGVANGWPMSGAMDPVSPPLVSWRSQQGDKSYLYDLRGPGHRAADERDPQLWGSTGAPPTP